MRVYLPFPLWLLADFMERDKPESCGVAIGRHDGQNYLPIFTFQNAADEFAEENGFGNKMEIDNRDTLYEIVGHVSRYGCSFFSVDPPATESGGPVVLIEISELYR